MCRLTDYVAGFAFSKGHVLLIRKARPAWQAGKLNGVGGHVEVNELPLHAMQREFFEETGLWTSVRDWRLFAVVHTAHSRVFMYALEFEAFGATLKPADDEPLRWVRTDDLPEEVLPNLRWLVPMALRAKDLPVPAIVHETAHYEAA